MTNPLKELSDAATQDVWFAYTEGQLSGTITGIAGQYVASCCDVSWANKKRPHPDTAIFIVTLVNKFRAGELVEATRWVKPLEWEKRLDCVAKSFDETGIVYTIMEDGVTGFHVKNNVEGYDCFSYQAESEHSAKQAANDHRLFMTQAMVDRSVHEPTQSAAEVRNAALREAADAMKPMLRSIISRVQASDTILALINGEKP